MCERPPLTQNTDQEHFEEDEAEYQTRRSGHSNYFIGVACRMQRLECGRKESELAFPRRRAGVQVLGRVSAEGLRRRCLLQRRQRSRRLGTVHTRVERGEVAF